MVEASVELATQFIDSQLSANQQIVNAEFQKSARSELADIVDGNNIFWDLGRGFTNAVDVMDPETGIKYKESEIFARIFSKTDVEYHQSLVWQTRGYISISCGECEGICCCTKTFPWALGEFPNGPGKNTVIKEWRLDSTLGCDPITGSIPICDEDRGRCSITFDGCRGTKNNRDHSFGDTKILDIECICFGCNPIVRNSLGINFNEGIPREYETVRIYQDSKDGIIDHKLLGVSNPSNRRYIPYVLRSFRIPHNDPQYNGDGGGDPNINPGSGATGLNQGYRLQQRSWMYDVALAVFAYVLLGRDSTAQALLRRAWLEQEQSSEHTINGLPGKVYPFIGQSFVDSTTGQVFNDSIFRPKGSIPFSFDQFIGLEFTPPYFRTGGNAWLGAAACYYMLKTGNTEFLQETIDMAEWMLTLQVTSEADPRFGLFTGGEGSFAGDAYIFTSGPRTWCSSEHNFDCHMFYRYLYILTLEPRYKLAYEMVEHGLMKTAYIEDEGRFAQGVRLPGDGTLGDILDRAYALDMWTWGGLFLTSIQQWGKAKIAYENSFEFFYHDDLEIPINADPLHFNLNFGGDGQKYEGFSTYFDAESLNGDITYPNAPVNIWPEGTWGAIMLGDRLGLDTISLKDSMGRMQRLPNMGGTMPAYTTGFSQLPYEQQVWPAVNPATWLIVNELDPNYAVFPIGFARYSMLDIEESQIANKTDVARMLAKSRKAFEAIP